VLLTRSPLEYPRKGLSVRLACVKHAASVRPEPESNSPNKNAPNPKAQAEFESEKPDHSKKTPKTGINQKTKPHPNTGSQNAAKNNNKTKPPNTLLSSQTTPVFGQPCYCTPSQKRRQTALSAALQQACAVLNGLLYPLDFSAETGQVLHEQRVTPVDVKDVVHLGVAVGDQAGKYESRACPDVR
jgi:hypothetical protein